MITPTEVKRKRLVTLIGWGTADRLFKGADPLDKQIKIAGMPFTVVGVSKKKGASFGQSLDEFAVIPLGSYQKLGHLEKGSLVVLQPARGESTYRVDLVTGEQTATSPDSYAERETIAFFQCASYLYRNGLYKALSPEEATQLVTLAGDEPLTVRDHCSSTYC